jgi:hypothetical protein
MDVASDDLQWSVYRNSHHHYFLHFWNPGSAWLSTTMADKQEHAKRKCATSESGSSDGEDDVYVDGNERIACDSNYRYYGAHGGSTATIWMQSRSLVCLECLERRGQKDAGKLIACRKISEAPTRGIAAAGGRDSSYEIRIRRVNRVERKLSFKMSFPELPGTTKTAQVSNIFRFMNVLPDVQPSCRCESSRNG